MNYEDYAKQFRSEFPDATEQEVKAGYLDFYGLDEAAAAGLTKGVYDTLGNIGSFGELIGLPTGDWAKSMYGRGEQFQLPEQLRGSLIDNPSLILNPTRLTYDVAGILPSIAMSVGGGFGARGLAQMFMRGMAPAKALPWLNRIGAGGSSLAGAMLESGGSYREGATPGEALLYGALDIPLQFFPSEHMMKQLTGQYGNSLGSLFKHAMIAGAGEAAQEWAEEPLQAAIQGRDITDAMLQGLNVVPASFIAGMVPGGARTAFQSVLNKKAAHDQSVNEQDLALEYLQMYNRMLGSEGVPLAETRDQVLQEQALPPREPKFNVPRETPATSVYPQQAGGGSWVTPDNFHVYQKTGKIAGAPDQEGMPVIQNKGEELVNAATRAYQNVPEAATWYERAGALIDQLSHGDPVLKERMTRLVAYLSPQQRVPENWKAAVETAYQMATGKISMQHLNMSARDIQNMLYAPTFSAKLRGVGNKVENFYQNLHDPAFGRDDFPDATTFDLWMARMLGYKNDSLSASQYRFAKDLMGQVTQEFNKRNGTDLKPRQVQALLWTQAQQMTGEAQPGYGFPEQAASASQNVTWEAVPSTSLPQGQRIAAMGPAKKMQYTQQARQILNDGNGGDALANMLGIPLYTETVSEGGYDAQITPNVITSLQARRPNGAYDRQAATAYARSLQYIYSQDAVPFFRADPAAEINHDQGVFYGVKLTVPNLQANENQVFALLRDKVSPNIGFTRFGNDLVVVNYPGANGTFEVDDKTFGDRLADVQKEIGATAMGYFAADSAYLGDWNGQDNWQTDPTGERLLAEINRLYQDSEATRGRPDLLARLRDWRQAAQQLTDQYEQQVTPEKKPTAYAMAHLKEPTSYRVRTKAPPQKTIRGYKLFQTKKGQPGKLFPLFIGSQNAIPMGEWLDAKFIPTKGFSERPGWHFTLEPKAPHLKPDGRVWAEVEISADRNWQDEADASPTHDIRDHVPADGYYTFPRPKSQGGVWRIGGSMKVLRVLNDNQVNPVYQQTHYTDLEGAVDFRSNRLSNPPTDMPVNEGEYEFGKNPYKQKFYNFVTKASPSTLNNAVGSYSYVAGVFADPVPENLRSEIAHTIDDVVENNHLPKAITDAFDVVAMHREAEDSMAAWTPALTRNDRSIPSTLLIDENWFKMMQEETDPVKVKQMKQALREVIAHEMGHMMSITGDDWSGSQHSPDFFVNQFALQVIPDEHAPMQARVKYGGGQLGSIIEEAVNQMNNPDAHDAGLAPFLSYPLSDIGRIAIKGGTIMDFNTGQEYRIDEDLLDIRPDIAGYLMKKTQPIVERMKDELFAQLNTLYLNRPALLKKFLPKAYGLMEKIHEDIKSAATLADIHRAVFMDLRATGPEKRNLVWQNQGRNTVAGGFEGGAGQQYTYPGIRAATNESVGPVSTGADQARPAVQGNFARVQERVGQVGGTQTAFEQKRGVQPNAVSADLATALGTDVEHLQRMVERNKGDIDNVEQLVGDARAVRQTWTEGLPQLEAFNQKIADGTLTDQDLADAGELLTRMAGIGAQFFGVRGEVGRALQIFRSTQDAVQKARYMVGMMDGINSREDLVEAIKAMSTVKEPGKAARQARALFNITKADYFMEWYYATLLSGLPTHVVNIVSTGIQGAVNELDNLVASGIGAITGSEDRITLAELKTRLGAVFKGARYGAQMFSNDIRNYEKDDYTPYGETKVERLNKRAIPGTLGKIIRIPTRFLSAEDSFWKGMFYTMGIAQEAQRLSASTGRSVEDLINNPTDEMRETAWHQAERNTFNERGGEIAQALQKLRKAHPVLNIIFPFVQTPGNIIKVAAKHTPAAFMFKEVQDDIKAGGRRKDLALARVAVGTSIMAATISMVMQGLISGQPPEDPNERRLWYMQGNQPYSVRMGNQWVSFSRLEPFGTLLGISADMYELTQRLGTDEAGEAWTVLIGSIFRNLTSKTYLRGLSDLVTMIQEPERYSEYYFQHFLSTLAVPTGVAYVARAMDDRRRMVNDLPDAIKARLPYLRQTLAERLDISGQPLLEEGSGLYRMFSPAYLQNVKDDPVAHELMKYEVSFPAIGKKYRGVELKPEDRNELIKMVGDPTYNALKRIVGSKTYQGMPDYVKKYTLQQAIDKLRAGARRYWAYSHPEIMREAMRMSMERRYGKYGQSE